MSYRLQEKLVAASQQSFGSAGGRVISSTDGAVTGDFVYIDPLDDVTISAITLKNNWVSPSNTRLIAVDPLPSRPIAIGFTSITLSAGTAIVYSRVP